MPAADTPRSEQCVGCRVTGSVTLAAAAVFLWRTPARLVASQNLHCHCTRINLTFAMSYHIIYIIYVVMILLIALTSSRSRLHRAVLSSVSGVLGVLGVARAADLPPFRQ